MDGARRNSTDPDLDAAMEKIWKKGEKQAREIAREGHAIQPDPAGPGRTLSDGALEDADQQQRSEGYRKSSVHDDISSTGQAHASSQFAHHHHHKSKLAKDSSHSVKKKSRKLSESHGDHMEDIQETAMPAEAPDEEDEPEAAPEVERSPPRGGSLSWMPDTRASAPALAMSGAAIPRSMQPVQDPRPEEEAHRPSHGDEHKKGGVLFQIGGDDDVEESSKQHSRKKHRKPSHVHKQHSREHHGHEAYENHGRPVTPTEGELEEHDQEDIGVHRFEKSKISHHVAHSVKNHPLTKQPNETKRMQPVGTYDPLVDHTPHELFVEMDELQNDGMKWKETARWIKYEEDLEETGQWGKPHVAALDCHSVIELIRVLNSGICMLDFAAKDMPDLLHRVVETLSESSIISEDQKVEVLRVLLYRHEHVTPQHTFPSLPALKRSLSSRSIQALVEERRASSATKEDHDKNHLVIDMKMEENLKRSSTQGSFKGLRRNDSFDKMRQERKQTIISCLRDGTEGCNVLVGELDDIQKPIVAFVRLEKALSLPNAIEVKLPVRFIFILLTPKWDKNLDVHEIGRSMSTMMADPAFHNKCYRMSHKQELLDGVSAFLDDAVVLPPGDWDTKNVLPVKQIMELKKRKNTRKMTMAHITENGGQKPAEAEMMGGGGGDGGGGDDKGVKKKEQRNPLKRTKKPFGGLLDDIWHRYAVYKSDILDGLNFQCFGATIFIYFAALSGAIAFGGLMGAKTGNNIGISETLIMSSFMGIVFSLLSGCPLIIVGVTGPLLLYDEALYSFTQNTFPLPFLNFRVFIGIWVFLIAMAVAAFEGSTLVRFFTKFTKDIFASLVSLLFIYEAIRKLILIFLAHPLTGTLDYCHHLPDPCQTLLDTSVNATDELKMNCTKQMAEQEQAAAQPNTALLSFILMFCTFMIAWGLRNFRNSQFLGRTIRRALGDFGVPIAIAIMVLIDFGFGDTYTEKLSVPDGLKVTNDTARGWFIPPMGSEDNPLPVWGAFVAGIPALLLYLLLFMETHICQLIMMEKTKEAKGAGLHLDIVLLSLMNLVSGMFGGPWICAATVRAVSHVSALTVMSTNNQPGVAPRVIGIKDQRVTSFFVSVLLGLSILMAPILKLVPFAVLFGVFLYMGFSGMNGVQFFDRVWLMLMPRKHHPDVSYVKLVSQPRMHLYTILQFIGLAVLWVVKSVSSIALAFPFFVIMMIPYRRVLQYIFTEKELDALDGVTAGTNMSGLKSDNEEKDFYEAAGECPTDAKAEAPLHRALSTEEE